MNPENRNMILAITLSMAVLFGWQMFVVGPELEKEAAMQQAIAEQEAAAAAASGDAPQVDPDAVAGSAGAAATGQLSASEAAPAVEAPRIVIDAPLVSGSISLAGLRVDDIMLKAYQETQDPDSENIQFLLKTSTAAPFFAEFGWASADAAQPMPKSDSVWTASSMVLSPGSPVTLTWENGNGLTFRRQLSINDDYMITVDDSVESALSAPLTLFPYGLVRRHGTPATTGIYILHEGALGVFDETLREEDYDDMRDADGGVSEIRPEMPGGWIGFTDKYWLAALLPDQSANMNFAFKSLAGPSDRYQVDYIASEASVLPAGGVVSSQTRLFAGAKKVSLLDGYADELGIANFDLAIDFGWFYFLTKPIFLVLLWIESIVGNLGISILILTLCTKALFFPLANKSYVAMSKMKKLQPELVKLRERYKDDKVRLNQEMMGLYKKQKVNPAAGCLPILVQIPVFFALYKVLFVTIEMRHKPFFGWIHDLSAPDPLYITNLFGLLPYTPPHFLAIGIWPVLMAFTMFLQQKLNPAPADPTQAKIMMFLPVMFLFLFAGFPAGLVIYWTWNNLLSIGQQWLIMRRMGVKV